MMLFEERNGFYFAKNAIIVGDVTLGKGANVWFGSVLRGDDARIRIGEYTNVQDLCLVHADPGVDLEVGGYVTIGHHATLHCKRIGDGALIGMGAILLAGAEIGEGAVIAAGALVTEGAKVLPRAVMMGVPARQVATVGEHEVEELRRHAVKYSEKAAIYASGRVPLP